MSQYAARVEEMDISGIREVFEAAGEDAINLGLGQPDFPTPEHAREAAVSAIRDGMGDSYTSNKGIPDLREAISDRYATDNGQDIPPENIIATAGASEAIHVAIEAHVQPGDEVLCPDPGFLAYEQLVLLAGGEPKRVELRDDLTLDPAAVENAITDNTSLFIVNSPANPTGAVQSKRDMAEFARIADEHEIICLSDEVYEKIVFDGEHHSPAEFASSDRVIQASACSKTYSMTGWRLGWVAASSERIERMLRVHQYVQACASAPSQYAAEAALTGPQEPVREMVSAFEERRDVLLDGLEDIGLHTPVPKGAFYAMPHVPDGWTQKMLDNDVIVVPGEAFGPSGKGQARISYATSTAELKEALEVMRTVTNSL
ncbi:pyridoxal phosphate-dependent aminotransferase [Haloarcula argentinensis]|uniref:Aminotransferase class I/II-fold pyridoxal phosphate-dependent enzyme n=1 Tax=Haloarcula argentinensis TaxID=43776 RepID=A0A847U7R8_HALAR|nr:pyridoxal phosphate-dependent aminotransferase [Haloarcula argentinensis]NLV11783.1 aminotransferase class I/II-fold pyridoxal phosphate-dependent enzyme [Haloarcula argentinensis]